MSHSPRTFSAFALIIFRFLAPFDTPSPSSLRGGVSGRGGRGLAAALALFDAAFSFRDGRLATLADRPMLFPSLCCPRY